MITFRTPGALAALTLTALFGLGLGVQPAARADTLATFTGGTNTNEAGFYYGQAFTTASGPDNNIVFSFLSTPATGSTPFAAGDLYLLSSVYTGTPNALSTSTPGFLGEATASGNKYTFAPGLTLLGGTQYFVYSDTGFAAGSIGGGAGSFAYRASSGNSNFANNNGSTDYRVTGSPVPEPASLLPITCGLMALAGMALVAKRRMAFTL